MWWIVNDETVGNHDKRMKLYPSERLTELRYKDIFSADGKFLIIITFTQ